MSNSNDGGDNNSGSSSDEEELAEDEYLVEAILDTRVEQGRRQYLLRWHGYEETENSWEDEENLQCEKMLEEFWAQHSNGRVRRAKKPYKKRVRKTTTGGRRRRTRTKDATAATTTTTTTPKKRQRKDKNADDGSSKESGTQRMVTRSKSASAAASESGQSQYTDELHLLQVDDELLARHKEAMEGLRRSMQCAQAVPSSQGTLLDAMSTVKVEPPDTPRERPLGAASIVIEPTAAEPEAVTVVEAAPATSRSAEQRRTRRSNDEEADEKPRKRGKSRAPKQESCAPEGSVFSTQRSSSSSEGVIDRIIGARRTRAGVELQVQWHKSHQTCYLPSRVVATMDIAKVLNFYEERLDIPEESSDAQPAVKAEAAAATPAEPAAPEPAAPPEAKETVAEAPTAEATC